MAETENGAPLVRELPRSEHDRWDQFVDVCEQGTLFHTTWWYRSWGMEPQVRVLENARGEIEAGICYAVGRRLGTKAIIRPPETMLNGPLFQPTAKAGRNSRNTHAKQMLLHIIGELPRLGMYDFVLHPDQGDVMPFIWNGFDVQIDYTYRFPAEEKETWLDHASTSQRRRLRKALKEGPGDGYTFDESPPLDDVIALVDEVAKLKGFAFRDTANRLPAWWDAAGQRNAIRVFMARDAERRPACVDVMVVDGRCAYHYLTGIRSNLRDGSHIHSLLVARMVDEAHKMGLDFDFSGSVLPGIERFKRVFGGELRPCYRVVKLPSLLAYSVWSTYHFFRGHGRRAWVFHD